VTNVDNESSGINVSAISGQTTEAGGFATFTISLASPPSADVSIALSGDASEGAISPSTIAFTAANWNVVQTVTVTGLDDAEDDGDVTYSITGVASGDPIYAALPVGAVSVTNTDNDAAGVTVSAISGPTTEAGGTATFAVSLQSQPTADVTIALSGDASEGSISPATVTFTAVDWNTAQTVTVTGLDDPEDDGDVTYTITGAVTAGDDSSYSALTPVPAVTVTNIDDDEPAVVAEAG
jgi:hypothetical protein